MSSACVTEINGPIGICIYRKRVGPVGGTSPQKRYSKSDQQLIHELAIQAHER